MDGFPSTAPPPTRRLSADDAGLEQAAALIAAGRLVALPTETVYGLGADATDPAAVAGIYAAKERPSFNPLIAHLPTRAAAMAQGIFDAHAQKLAEHFWPGPLTLVVPVAPGGTVCDLARAGLDSVALRVPGHALARDLLARVGRPVAAPSANRSGRVSPTRAAHVLADLDGRIAAILDGGDCPVGVESSVVACLGGPPRLLRPGGVTREALAAVLGFSPETGGEVGRATGRTGPARLPLRAAGRGAARRDADRPRRGVLLFGAFRPEGLAEACAAENLSEAGIAEEAAARLFSALRRLDASGASVIAVAPVPEAGLGEAINDRLRRAAAPR